MIGRRNRSTLILLIIMGLLVISAYYSGSGAKATGAVQRVAISALAPVHRLVTNIVSPFKHGWRYVISFRRMHDDNARLRKENLKLKHHLSELSLYRRENQRLKKLVGFQQESKLKTIAAKVIGRTSSTWQAVLIIDKGSQAGIRKNMPVVVDSGLVGQIVEASGNAANVMLLIDEKSGVGVENERTGQLGVVEGRLDGVLKLKFVPKDADIKKGDRLITSGIGKVYPRNLFVGTVAEIKENQYGMEKNIKVRPAVNFNKLEEVLMINQSNREKDARAVSSK